MDSVIEHLPVKERKKLDRKAKASGRTIEAEAAAIIAGTLASSEEEADPVEAFLKTVDGIYGENRPQKRCGRVSLRTPADVGRTASRRG
jgi:hypothetical protein